MEKEIENLKTEISKSKQHDTSSEFFRAIEKYEKEKDLLAEHNQVFALGTLSVCSVAWVGQII